MNRILVVDDSLSVRKVLERLLSTHAEVSVAVSAEDALVQLDAGTPMPDLLISDVLMPGMGGLELAQALGARADTAHIPVVLISGIVDDQLTLQAKAAGIYALVRKPFTVEELLPIILQAMAVPVSPPASQPAAMPYAPAASSRTVAQTVERAAPQTRPEHLSSVASAQPVPDAPVSLFTAADAELRRAATSADPTYLELLTTLIKRPGVVGVMVTTQNGVAIGSEGELNLPAADLAMYARFFASSATVLGKRLGSTEHLGVQIDFSSHTLLILPLGIYLLVSLVADASSSSMVRFALRRYLNAETIRV